MTDSHPLFIPVVLGTPRQGRQSEHAARLVAGEIAKRDGSEAELVEVGELAISTQDTGEAIKDPGFSATVNRADGVVNGDIVDGSIRPNQVFALSLAYPILSGDNSRSVLEVVEGEMLTPAGLRSLAPGDPQYRSVYDGGPLSRDGAYHQGTV